MSEITAYEIVLTDAELEEREDWIRQLMLQPDPSEDPIFEYDLENWEANR
jgi:hypothetical protein